MYKILFVVLLINNIQMTIADDLQTAYEEHFLLYLEEILDQCETFLTDMKDLFEQDTTGNYLPDDVGALNYDQLKNIKENVTNYVKQQSQTLLGTTQQVFDDNYKTDYDLFLANDLTDSNSLKSIERQYKKTINLANQYNKGCVKAAELLSKTHIDVLFLLYKDCSKNMTCQV